MERIRFGALGAARIAPAALIQPARNVDRCEVVAVAARDPARAARFARQHGIPNAVGYAELVAHPDVDAVYVGLPASHHHHWSLEALRAGKHVLCEKPFTCGVGQAEELVAVAAHEGLVCCEAFHYRYHPLMARVLEICRSGALGRIERLEGTFFAPIGDLSDIRYVLALGGGAVMDLGCYPIHWMRTILGEEPDVVAATAKERPAGVDEAMVAELRFPGGAVGTVACDMAKEGGFELLLRVFGTDGELSIDNLLAPGFGHTLRRRGARGNHDESVDGATTYDCQLRAFTAAVLDGAALATGGDDAIANMRVIEAIYASAGLPARAESARLA